MAIIPQLSNGEPIDYNRINQIIAGVNEAQTAGSTQAIVSRDTTYHSTDDNIVVQAFRRTFRPDTTKVYTTVGGASPWTVSYPMKFSISPIITVTFDAGGQYLVPYVTSVGTSSFQLGVIRIGQPQNTATLNSPVNANIIAVGPFGGLPQ